MGTTRISYTVPTSYCSIAAFSRSPPNPITLIHAQRCHRPQREIRRLARKEAKAQVAALKKASAQQRRDIAALKRQLTDQQRANAKLAKAVSNGRAAMSATSTVRFSPTWLQAHRAKLGLSAADYARLVGVSGLTIYNWEKGKTKPRQAQLEKLAEVRGMGKREAIDRIGGKTKRGRAKKA